ncbi:MAG: hypothetical protein Q9228_008027, partial [Teloschistes exilis]
PARAECKSAIAFLPLPHPALHTFGPDIPQYAYRTPIKSNHTTKCTARVDIRPGFKSEESSWEDVRAVFREMSRQCLDREKRTGSSHTMWTFECLNACKYLQAVMNETFRLNPTIGQMSRAALRDTVLPTGGGSDTAAPVFVKKGTTLITSFYALHRSRDRWGQDADLWRPERWLKIGVDGLRKVPHWTFLPFGGGPRICIGM